MANFSSSVRERWNSNRRVDSRYLGSERSAVPSFPIREREMLSTLALSFPARERERELP
jgi:hypothetical protein